MCDFIPIVIVMHLSVLSCNRQREEMGVQFYERAKDERSGTQTSHVVSNNS
jgi:hypothetical protein